MDQYAHQEMIESQYNRKHIDARIKDEIEASEEIRAARARGVQMLQEWMQNTYYDSKNKRLAQLQGIELEELVTEIFVGVAYCQRPVLFTSVTAQLAGRLRFSDKPDAIRTIAEIVAVLCLTDAYDIMKENKMASLMIVSRIQLSNTLVDFITNSEYLPPMVCEPMPLTSNYSSGYLTHIDSLILGKGNHHDGDICRDVLEIVNKVPLKLDKEFLSTVEETPTFDIISQEQQELWDDFKKQSYRFYALMFEHGNRIHLTHKVDKRGRIYAQGYHITTQGTSFKKAMIELANEELVEGVPND